MKPLAILAIFVILTPIAAYGQVPTNTIIIETFLDSNAVAKSTEISVTIQGQLGDGGVVKLSVNGIFDSNSVKTYEKTHTFTKDNPKYVFELDYPFLPKESYIVNVANGLSSRTIQWVPLPGTLEQQKVESSSNQETSQSTSNTSGEAQSVVTQEEQANVQATSDDLAKSLREENDILKQKLEKKGAVIMEQIKVIQDLASKIKNAIYDDHTSKLNLVADTSQDEVQSLMEENKLLKQEIEKKDAVIMEQIKVILDLASKIKNVDFEPMLNYLSA